MESSEEEPSPSKPHPRSSFCQECSQNPSKYTCPGCSIRTCSLPCVKSHKQRTNCTGKRPRTPFVPLSRFDDHLLISDYNFLEETKRVAESAQRMRDALFRSYGFRLPIRQKLLRNAAGRRNTQLLLLPSGMERREKNQSIFLQRKKSILWTIEWRFHSTNVVLLDHGVDEHVSLFPVIEKHLKPAPWNHPLKPFCEDPFDSLKFFIQKNPKGPKSPFRELNIKTPISQQLAGIVIVEYPVIHVFLPSHSYDFEVEKEKNTSSKDVETAEPSNDIPSSKCVLFRVEEINEDDAAFDTQVIDFMNYMNQEPLFRGRVGEKESSPLMGASEDMKPVCENRSASRGGDMNGYFHCDTKASGAPKDMDFDFGQDLQDAYSALIEQVNPDDFLCLDGGFAEEEELEEGEIAEF